MASDILDCIAMAFLDLFAVSVKSWSDMIMVMWRGGLVADMAG